MAVKTPASKVGTKATDDTVAGSSKREGEGPPARKLRVMCLHGFRTSARIMQKQIEVAQWIPLLDDLVEFVYMEAPYAASGKSASGEKFEPPFFEWYQANQDYTEVYGLEESIEQIAAFIKSRGPFDGLMGFSQGGVLSGALVGLQEKGLALRDIEPFRFVVVIGSAVARYPLLKPAYLEPIRTSSLHFIGEKDFMRKGGELLVQAYRDPTVIRHPHGHLIPRLAQDEAEACRAFFEKFFNLKYPEAKSSRPLSIRAPL
ncbi:hypothetical protein R1sor_020131 [Riccia sorocarpa]|uniref:Serine hydrolase domain-containing protein n=1 Tax=Riccia sorocarpa TaxID=122646 RepID=A0ABD3IKR8_9MARC